HRLLHFRLCGGDEQGAGGRIRPGPRGDGQSAARLYAAAARFHPHHPQPLAPAQRRVLHANTGNDLTMSAIATGAATLWAPHAITFTGPREGNPFLDVTLRAVFRQGERQVRVSGFYDGEGVYKLRFLPDTTGEWTYETTSNSPALDGQQGSFAVGPALPGHHGPVRVANRHHFRHADGTRFIPIGTTAYVWNLQGAALEEETLPTLRDAPSTKTRMCVFPKHYRYNENEP